MPQHKSAVKRVRQNERRRAQNRYHRSRMRTLIKKLENTEAHDESVLILNEAKAYLDRMVCKHIIHKNKAANYKSALEKAVNARA